MVVLLFDFFFKDIFVLISLNLSTFQVYNLIFPNKMHFWMIFFTENNKKKKKNLPDAIEHVKSCICDLCINIIVYCEIPLTSE